VTTDLGLLEQGFSYAQGYSLAIQPDGKLVLAGAAYIGTGFDAALARYDSNGALDLSFGTGGKMITDMCVLKVALDLFDQAIEPIILVDCCASTAGLQAHLAGLAVLARNIGALRLRDAGLGEGHLGAPPIGS
jgi:hypothetical protein